MTAKRVRLSSDGGSTYFTLPGNSAELRNEAGEIVDTIFGQDFQSTESGLIGWSITSNALYKGFAGYEATIKVIGTAVAATGEAMTLVSGQTYQINDATKQIWDRSAAVTVLDGVTDVTDQVEKFDYLFGKVTFLASYTVVGAITVDVSYFPTSALGGARGFTLTQTAEGVDNTDLDTAHNNGGYRTFQYGLKTVTLETNGIWKVSNANLAKLNSRGEFIIEINPDGSSNSLARGFFRLTSQSQSGNVGELEEESLSWALNVPDDDDLATPFGWAHSGTTTLNQAIRIGLDAWENSNIIDARYLPDGATGFEGNVVVTEVSLAGGLEVMNEFSVTLQGSGTTTAV